METSCRSYVALITSNQTVLSKPAFEPKPQHSREPIPGPMKTQLIPSKALAFSKNSFKVVGFSSSIYTPSNISFPIKKPHKA